MLGDPSGLPSLAPLVFPFMIAIVQGSMVEPALSQREFNAGTLSGSSTCLPRPCVRYGCQPNGILIFTPHRLTAVRDGYAYSFNAVDGCRGGGSTALGPRTSRQTLSLHPSRGFSWVGFLHYSNISDTHQFFGTDSCICNSVTFVGFVPGIGK